MIDMAAILGREFDRSLLAHARAARRRGPRAGTRPARRAGRAPAGQRRADRATSSPTRCCRRRPTGGSCAAAGARCTRRVADTLVRSFAEIVEREPEVVAHHWSAAGGARKAVPFWHAAGTRALERAAYLEAAEHFRRGLEALDAAGAAPRRRPRARRLPDPPRRPRCRRGAAMRPRASTRRTREARTACERAGNDDRLVPVIRGQWMFHLLRGEYATALELADEMLALGRARRPPGRARRRTLYRGLAHMYLGQFDLAREHLDEAFTRYRRPDRSDQHLRGAGRHRRRRARLPRARAVEPGPRRRVARAQRPEPRTRRAGRRPGDARAGLGHAQHPAPEPRRAGRVRPLGREDATRTASTTTSATGAPSRRCSYGLAAGARRASWSCGTARLGAEPRRLPGLGLPARPTPLPDPARRPAARRGRPAAERSTCSAPARSTSRRPASASRSPSCSASRAGC